ncbi:hypothetical protein [Rhizobium herbae]|uniref:Glycosyl transferase family 2 n=1 Tax=Rhizobium herbae TaxID=508661 RepID=A0ABS4EJX1_9HYPH|nr:hypothetical protein [Rhizobium herbae]MBP1858238.1 hypothetical protein [Rhizobium herbae]
MTKLSICIPVETAAQDALPLVTVLLENQNADIEIVIAKPADIALSDALLSLAAEEARVTVADAPADITRQLLWRHAATAAKGEWVTLVNPGDMIESELATMVAFLEASSPDVDALAWNAFQIDRHAEPGKASSVAIPASYHIDTLDKTAMLKAFFYWEGSLNSPKMPFGLYHAAIRRSLVDALLQLPEPQDWSTSVPQYEWAAKVLLFANELAFCARPMSAINISPFVAEPPLHPWNFPFHSGIGLAGAVAEVQFHVLRQLDTPWSGGSEAFVRALMIDCMMETDRETYKNKGNAYFAALKEFEGGYLAPLFRPEFHEVRPRDARRGLHDGALLVDRFLGGARDAAEFYTTVKLVLAPVGLICGGVLRDENGKAA